MSMLTKEQFFAKIDEEINKMPSNWRKGQKTFNAVDMIFGVAREVQFHHKIDCFYDDSKINEFIEKSYEVYKDILNKSIKLKVTDLGNIQKVGDTIAIVVSTSTIHSVLTKAQVTEFKETPKQIRMFVKPINNEYLYRDYLILLDNKNSNQFIIIK